MNVKFPPSWTHVIFPQLSQQMLFSTHLKQHIVAPGFICWGAVYLLHLCCVLMTGCCKANCPSGIIKIYTGLFCAISAALHLPHIWGGDHSNNIKQYDPFTTSHSAATSLQKPWNNNKSWSQYTQESSYQIFTRRRDFMNLVFFVCWLFNVLLISTWMIC